MQIDSRIKEVLATIPEKRVTLNSILLGLDTPQQATRAVPVVNGPPVVFHSAHPASSTSGYSLSYLSAGVLVYGTGYYSPPYVVPVVVPIYFSYSYSYAGAIWYNPPTGASARGGSVYGPTGTAPPCMGHMVEPMRGRPITRPPVPMHMAAGPGARTAGGFVCQLHESHDRPSGQHDAELEWLLTVGIEHDQRAKQDDQYGQWIERSGYGSRASAPAPARPVLVFRQRRETTPHRPCR